MILQAFLKALNLPGGDEELNNKSSVRSKLQLDIEAVVSAHTDNQNTSGDKQELTISTNEINEASMHEENDNLENVAAKVVGAFDRKMMAQQNFETGLVKFKLSLKGGILFFIENGFTTLDAKDLALFFHTHKEKLDKTQIGEALGKEPEYRFVKDKNAHPEQGGEGFFVRVLHHYVSAMDFTDLEFDDAIRSFLSGFRLPGEAQKVRQVIANGTVLLNLFRV